MLKKKFHTLRTHPSLFPLRAVLSAAERESPARPRHVDSNERLAVLLIARMQAAYKKAHPFMAWREEPRGMAGGHAR